MIELNKSLYSKTEKSILNILLNVIIVVIAVALIFELIFVANYSGIYVVGTSMNNTLTGAVSEDEPGGDYVYANRNAKPSYNDIVVVEKVDVILKNGKSVEETTTIIKRVIALGGDYVKLIDGYLYIKHSGEEDFSLIKEPYVHPDNNTGKGSQPINFPLVNGVVKEDGFYVEEGYLFLLGDNRDWSLDSRESGGRVFPLSSLYGVVTHWSINGKAFFSAVHQYFTFDLPKCFGL